MNLAFMSETVSALTKRLLAMLAIVWLLFGMDPNMFFVGTGVTEGGMTVFASKRLFTGMNSHMSG